MSQSAIYTGHVAHMRPGKHRLRYRVFMLGLDLNELDQLDQRLTRFSRNRFGLLSFFDRDHGDRSGAPLLDQIERKVREAGIVWAGGRVVLMTMPRILNYVFNPLSVYFCYDDDGRVVALVYEVSNTFGERHFYVLAPESADGRLTQSCGKTFFVSPFLEMALRYEFTIVPPSDRCLVSMVVRRSDAVALTASFAGDRLELTDANLARVWRSNPLMTLKVIAGIHWEALKMVFKGIRYLGRPPEAANAPERAEGVPVIGGNS